MTKDTAGTPHPDEAGEAVSPAEETGDADDVVDAGDTGDKGGTAVPVPAVPVVATSWSILGASTLQSALLPAAAGEALLPAAAGDTSVLASSIARYTAAASSMGSTSFRMGEVCRATCIAEA